MVLLAYSGLIQCHPIRFSVQYLQSLKCMEYNETFWLGRPRNMVCADPLSQVSKYAGKVYSVANISTVCDRVSFRTPSEVASRVNAQQTTTEVFRRSGSHFTWHWAMETWRQINGAQWTAQAHICVHVDWKRGYELSSLYESQKSMHAWQVKLLVLAVSMRCCEF